MGRGLAAALVLGLGLAGAAQAESLRCNGRIIEVGEPRVNVLRFCGEPAATDSYCRPVELMPPPGWRRPWYANDLPCRTMDEWLYDRGPGNLMALVRFESGRIHSIEYTQRGP